ncbi:MAG: MmgE/PrpD family protein, partial [Deltaproteobacteria bacterium]|nr:MmgE/PrpD family protein [Deltaproteobacteria bacterium]
MTTTEKLAQIITQFDPASITASMEHAIRRCLLDLIGVACAGFKMDGVRAVRATAKRLFPKGKSSVWLSETKLTS